MEENQNRKAVTRRKARNTAIAGVILLLLFVAAGIAYTWYMDQKPQPASSKTKAETPAVQAIKPMTPKPETQESAAIEYLSSPVASGDSASVNVKTVATSNCTISVTYNNVASKDDALKPKVADDFGNVQWSWTISRSAPTGTWPVKVTCSWHGKTAMVEGDLQVAR